MRLGIRETLTREAVEDFLKTCGDLASKEITLYKVHQTSQGVDNRVSR